MHGALRIGDAVMELGEPEDRAGIPTNGMFLFVEDVDAVYARALERAQRRIALRRTSLMG